MKGKWDKVLFVTSFLPVAIFKIIARVGDATWGQAKTAVLVGFLLAVIQYTAARRILKFNTYMEKAFLGFLLVGTVWVYALPEGPAHIFVDHSVALLYFTLFLMTFLPQVFGYDPFTFAIARQWYPRAVWETMDFRILNYRITYVWSGIFLTSALSSFWGQGRPFYSIVIPFSLCIGVGVIFSKTYPDYYLKRKYRVRPETAISIPDSADKLIMGMPNAFDPKAARDLQAQIQYDISGEEGGQWFLIIGKGKCEVKIGETQNPDLKIQSPADVWVKIAKGEIDRPKALMQGLFKVEGDMKLLVRLPQLFGGRARKKEK